MNKAERAAEAERAAALMKELGALSDAELQKRAEDLKLDVSKCKNRDEVEAAIEKHEHDAAGKARLEAMKRAEADARDREPSDTAKVLHRLNHDFCRDIPQEGRGGTFVPDDGSEFSGSYFVPDGTYRVVGSDWLFVIKGRKLAQAMTATAANKYGGKDVIEV
jgi:membrane protein involved in colicin uptake